MIYPFVIDSEFLRCTGCGLQKRRVYFSVKRDRPTGRYSYCKRCESASKQRRIREGRRPTSGGSAETRHNNRLIVVERLLDGCNRCGYDNINALHFHHIVREEKRAAISSMMNCSTEVLKAELDKCEVICANCHAIEHKGLWKSRYAEFIPR